MKKISTSQRTHFLSKGILSILGMLTMGTIEGVEQEQKTAQPSNMNNSKQDDHSHSAGNEVADRGGGGRVGGGVGMGGGVRGGDFNTGARFDGNRGYDGRNDYGRNGNWQGNGNWNNRGYDVDHYGTPNIEVSTGVGTGYVYPNYYNSGSTYPAYSTGCTNTFCIFRNQPFCLRQRIL